MERFFARVIGFAHYRSNAFVSKSLLGRQNHAIDFGKFQKTRKFSTYQHPSAKIPPRSPKTSPPAEVPVNTPQDMYSSDLTDDQKVSRSVVILMI
jgi:hypothetical protein